jgi:regulatory protein
MAQSRRVNAERYKKTRPPLDEEALERTALFYVGRYATTRAKLRAYLTRKTRERGWKGPGAPSIDALVERMSVLGYVDDGAFAAARAASLRRRGYGERRVEQTLRAAGIEEEDAAAIKRQGRDGALAAGLRFAERKGLGPYGPADPDRHARERAFAQMARAGHPVDVIRRVLDLAPHEIPECDSF